MLIQNLQSTLIMNNSSDDNNNNSYSIEKREEQKKRLSDYLDPKGVGKVNFLQFDVLVAYLAPFQSFLTNLDILFER